MYDAVFKIDIQTLFMFSFQTLEQSVEVQMERT